jgi:hypothetical protein
MKYSAIPILFLLLADPVAGSSEVTSFLRLIDTLREPALKMRVALEVFHALSPWVRGCPIQASDR